MINQSEILYGKISIAGKPIGTDEVFTRKQLHKAVDIGCITEEQYKEIIDIMQSN